MESFSFSRQDLQFSPPNTITKSQGKSLFHRKMAVSALDVSIFPNVSYNRRKTRYFPLHFRVNAPSANPCLSRKILRREACG
jgi:hypothetical protein